MKLTRQEAIEKHRALWHEIARRTREEKRFVNKWEVITEDGVYKDCYLCEYDYELRLKSPKETTVCYFCPLEGQKCKNGCLNGLCYNWWTESYKDKNDYKLVAELADQIAELPEANFNDVEIEKE